MGINAALSCMDARLLDWSDLEIFLSLARDGTLAAAAITLRVDASTVQRRIGKLEHGLKTRLFDRSQRGYSLTTAGEELLSHVLEMERHAVAAQRKVVAHDESLTGVVRVTTVDDLAVMTLPAIVQQFREQHPKLTVQVDVRTSLADLGKQQAHVAIRFGERPSEGDVVAKQLARVDVALYASAAYLKRHGRLARLEDLRRHAIVRGDEQVRGLPTERLIDRYCEPAQTAFRSNSFFARLGAVRDGVGVGFLSYFMAERQKGLTRLPFVFPDAASHLWLLVHVDIRRNARVRAFVEHAQAALVALRPQFEAERAG